MFIAHLPAAYLLTDTASGVLHRRGVAPGIIRAATVAGLAAGLAPDLDMFYFHLIDNRSTPHHLYWTHIPFYWFCLTVFCTSTARLARIRGAFIVGAVFMANILLHLALDTVASSILWAAPFINKGYGLFFIPSKSDWWVMNYIFHWTFLIELGIVLAALVRFMRRPRRPLAGYLPKRSQA